MARSSASAAAWNCGREGLRNFHLADLCVIGTCDAATGGSALARAGGGAVRRLHWWVSVLCMQQKELLTARRQVNFARPPPCRCEGAVQTLTSPAPGDPSPLRYLITATVPLPALFIHIHASVRPGDLQLALILGGGAQLTNMPSGTIPERRGPASDRSAPAARDHFKSVGPRCVVGWVRDCQTDCGESVVWV